MKNFLFVALAAIVFGPSANADFVHGRVRPVMRAQLTQVEGQHFPRATSLSLNREDGKREPVSFTLQEDTGLRCITAPCPSDRTSEFKIVKIELSLHNEDVVKYEAVEVLKNIPPHVKIAPRKLNVSESSMELVAPGGGGFMRRTMWTVEVLSFPNTAQIYTGSPKHLFITMDSDF